MRKEESTARDMNRRRLSVFYDEYREPNPIKRIGGFLRKCKWAWQRATRGYCDADTWDIFSWFLNVMPPMLDQMAEEAHGCPGDIPSRDAVNSKAVLITEEEQNDENFLRWKKILHTMAQKFRDADESTTSMKNPYEEDWYKAYQEFEHQYGMFGEKLEKEAVKQKAPGIRLHFPNEFPEWKDVMEKYREEEKKIAEFRHKSMEEGMDMFKTWFWDLWD